MSSSALTPEERFAGCLLGGAIGDALGAPIEFLSLARIREQFGEDEMALEVPDETSRAIEQAVALAQGGEEPSPELVETLGAAWIAEQALAISIYCALVARDYSHAVLLAVNYGGDSDSTGAITGNLLEIPANYFPNDEDERAYSADVFRRYPGC